jgi:alkylation response protein AidB-like acyl-CoA dehydrogenase
MSQCWKVSHVILAAGTGNRRRNFFQVRQRSQLYHLCLLNEPDSGSDNILPYNAPDGGVALKAVLDGDSYVLNGSKHFNSLVGFSKLLLVYGRTDPKQSVRQGTSTFLVPHDLPGITYGQIHNKMGFRLYPNGETFFDNVRVPKEYMIGGLNAGFKTFAQVFRGSLELPATYLGICKAMYRTVLDHAKQRVQGGKPIIEHQSVGSMLAEIALTVDTLEGYMWDTAYRLEHDGNFDAKKTIFGKIFACECAVKIMNLETGYSGRIWDHETIPWKSWSGTP